MASEVDICNIALGYLGDTATVASLNPPEGSAQAEHCARYYPIARDELLEMHTWNFAMRRETLALLATQPIGWQFAYAMPADAVRIISVHAPGEGEAGSGPCSTVQHPFTCESDGLGGRIIYCNVDDAAARYTMRVVDTTRFSPLFVSALTWHLAAKLAGPLIKGDSGAAMAQRCTQTMMAFLQQARLQDSAQQHIDPVHRPDWIMARGATVESFNRRW